MNQNITKYLKKNILLIVLIIIGGFILSLCSAGSDSNSLSGNLTSNDEPNQVSQQKDFFNFSLDGQDKSGNFELFYKTMLAVVLVIVMGAAAIILTKKLLPKIGNMSGKQIKIIETVNLGPRKSVHLLEINNRRLLIGSTNENINKLADLTEFTTDISIPENEI